MPETQLESRTPKLETDLKELAQDIVRRALSGGATSAECVVREGDEFSTLVRLGQVETLKEAGSKAMGLRVLVGQRNGSSYTSDFSSTGVDRLVQIGFLEKHHIDNKTDCNQCWARPLCAGGCYHEAHTRYGDTGRANLHYCEWIRGWTDTCLQIYGEIAVKNPRYLEQFG